MGLQRRDIDPGHIIDPEIAIAANYMLPANDTKPQDKEPRRQPANTRVHGAVWKSLGFFFYGILGVFALAFREHGETLFMLGICFIYLTFYLGGPLLFMRQQGEVLDDGTSLEKFLKQPFSTFTGHITGKEAWIQICMIPGALFFTAAGMALIFTLTVG